MHDGFMKLSDIFKNEPGLNGIRKIISQSDVVIEFNKIFPDLEKIAVPIKVDKKVLLLKVENPAWRNELKFKEELIIHKVNKFFKEERIKWVKLTT